ncbi:hypothetical protein PybrP1_005057 [[Pythium] brassicae (nom. inval.)]|nr:hypothetical protein PybrP1_005057 [[Pythium] brassicae (nom. inval.)]
MSETRTRTDVLAKLVLFLSTTESRSKVYRQVDVHEEGPQTRRRQAIIAALARVELLFGDARKVYRLLQFLEMTDMFRNVNEELRVVRVLRRLRVACFFLFYALENWMLFQLRVRGLPARDPRVKALKRGLNGFWCLSILLAFPLDHLMGRNGALSTLKKLLDLPVAYVAFSDQRVSDGLFGALGLASGNIGVYLRWVEVMRKLQATQSGATNAVGNDVA